MSRQSSMPKSRRVHGRVLTRVSPRCASRSSTGVTRTCVVDENEVAVEEGGGWSAKKGVWSAVVGERVSAWQLSFFGGGLWGCVCVVVWVGWRETI